MVIQEQTLYAGGAGIAFVAAVAAAVLISGFEGKTRRHMLLMPAALAVLALGYLGMALELFVATSPVGEPVYFTRYGTYLLSYTFLMSYIGLVAGAKLRYRLIPAGAVLGFTFGTVLVQLAPPPLDSVGSLVVLGSLVAVFWAFFGPLTRAAASVSGDRRLLFAKLRNLAALAFIMYLLVAFTNRSALGLLDAFVGVFTIAYVDLVAHVGLAGLIVYSGDAIESVTAEHSSPFATFTSQQTPAADVPGDD